LLERQDVANKSELSRLAMAQQRMQPGVSGTGPGSLGLADGNARVQCHGISSANQPHQGAQSSGGIGSHDGGSSHGLEPEQSGVESSDQALHQSTSTINAASAFDAAKDIMEALRSKHTNLASELEVMISTFDYFFS
jgi:transformation/transcription domain-associated protein